VIYFLKEFGKPCLDILNEVQNDPIFRNPGTDRQMYNYFSTILHDAMDPILSYAKQYRVPVDQIDEKTAESLNIAGKLPVEPVSCIYIELTFNVPKLLCSAVPCGRTRRSKWISS
jgi:hypothetical protein